MANLTTNDEKSYINQGSQGQGSGRGSQTNQFDSNKSVRSESAKPSARKKDSSRNTNRSKILEFKVDMEEVIQKYEIQKQKHEPIIPSKHDKASMSSRFKNMNIDFTNYKSKLQINLILIY